MHFSKIEWFILGIVVVIIIFTISWIFLLIRNKYKKTDKIETYQKGGITDKNFNIYYFYHPLCTYCKELMPVWNKIQDKYGSKRAHKINATESQHENLIFYYNVTKYPTIILSVSGRNIKYSGNRTVRDIESFINSHI